MAVRPDRVFDDGAYGSNDGMMTRIWGPALWHSLHTVSFNYPVRPTTAQKRHHATFVCSLGKVLPCGHCRTNFAENLAAVGFTNAVFVDRASFSRFVHALHEHVNWRLGKPPGPTYEAVRDLYEGFRSRCLAPAACAAPGAPPAPGAPESGCVDPLYAGTKSRCLLRIVPDASPRRTFAVHPGCELARARGS